MDLDERIKSFAALGDFLRKAIYNIPHQTTGHLNTIIERQQVLNPWFTPVNVRLALSSIANELTSDNLMQWTSGYPNPGKPDPPRRIGVIMAGNLPLVGFHDFLSVLISGHKIIAKTSSRDCELIKYLGEILCTINPVFRDLIEFTEGILTGFDAVIATGSNNTSRYFEYYFRKYPCIIRKNRNSIAILCGDESDDELSGLGNDIFSYFGFGCRNVSKLYIPRGYDLAKLTGHWDSYEDIISHTKYANNYEFNKAVFLVNRESFHDTGYLLLKENEEISSPVSVVYYEYYDSLSAAIRKTGQLSDKIQCIVGRDHIAFGKAQSPKLWEYADGTDTMKFLQKI